MSMTHVSYTVRAEYVTQNQEYIRRVVDEIRALGRTDIKYSVFIEDDGKTFIHLLLCETAEGNKVFGTLESQRVFQSALRESRPETATVMTSVNLVASSYDIF